MRRQLRAIPVTLLAVVSIGLAACHDEPGRRPTSSAHLARSSFQIGEDESGAPLRHEAIAPTGDGRPLLLVLHGKGSSPSSWLREPMPSVLRKLDRSAPVVVAVDGGDHTYYHDRAGGDWGSMVVDEIIPAAEKRFHTDPSCIGIAGFSMGGFGAIDLALEHPSRFQLVGLHDAAIWQSGVETAPGAFDDAEDFARHDVIELARTRGTALKHAHVHIDRGTSSPFESGIDALTAALQSSGVDVTTSTWSGEHSIRSLRPHLVRIMNEYAEALDC